MSRFNKYLIAAGIILVAVLGTYIATEKYFEHQFKIIYSLDKKQNDQEVINLINSANKYIYFAVYTFTKDNIADALIKAKQRGLIVWGITDAKEYSNEYEKPIIQRLRDAGITVEVQKHTDGIMHIKAVVTDKAYAMGSFNWTETATVANDELLEIGYNKYLHNQYAEIVKRILLANQ